MRLQFGYGPTTDAMLLDLGTLAGWLPAPNAATLLAPAPWIAKRVCDVALASLLLLLVTPVLAVAAALIRLSGPGPVIFRQERIGYRGRRFTMYKLRTMVDGAAQLESSLLQKASGQIFFKLHSDPRVTRVGRFLRTTSIDELPQLLNVIQGDMSLVGPRPLLPNDIRQFPRSGEQLRFAMLPGITGLWQVSGRSSCSEEERLQLDTRYVEEWSLWLDARILLRTLPAVVLARGAV